MNDILKTEYSEAFDKERKARIATSFYKYGPARDNFGGGRVDAVATAERCIDAFKKDHNLEHLVDAANYLMYLIVLNNDPALKGKFAYNAFAERFELSRRELEIIDALSDDLPLLRGGKL